MKNHYLLVESITASIKAGREIMKIYDTDFEVTQKSDKSPLTLADRLSHETITSLLEKTGIPVLSEEGRDIPYEERRKWKKLWIVDPLDGTKEFIKKNDEFTVNIALLDSGSLEMGVIFIPVSKILYFGEKSIGSFKIDDPLIINKIVENHSISSHKNFLDHLIENSRKLSARSFCGADSITIAGSRSHGSPELDEFIRKKNNEFINLDFISIGSSLKFCLVAEGKADVYPRFGPTMEWDTAAGQAIAENAGAEVLDMNSKIPLVYNKQDLHNPFFIVKAKTEIDT